MWSNYHAHSVYCDGKSDLTSILKQSNVLMSLGFSSHAPLPFDCGWCMKYEKLPDYLSSIEKLKSSTRLPVIDKGLEVDFIPGIIKPADFNDALDYTIGSIHFVESFPDGNRWEIDGQHQLFLEGFERIFHNRIKDAIVRYYELIGEMVMTSCPSIVGHFDKIKIQNIHNKFFLETDAWYREIVEDTLNRIRASGAIIEVNTRGLYQKKTITPYPSPWILEIVQQKNIPITLSSDAHHPDYLTACFEETARQLHAIGFRKLSVLKEGKWQPVQFNEHGLIT